MQGIPIEAGGNSFLLQAAEPAHLRPLASHEQACGATPVNGLIEAARRKGLLPTLLDLRNSGDTAGDKSRVVGYSAFAFTAPASP